MVCIDRAMLQDNLQRLQPDTFLRIVRMQNVASIYVFQMSDVFAKRSVIKGGDILRTLAVSEMREKFDFEVIVIENSFAFLKTITSLLTAQNFATFQFGCRNMIRCGYMQCSSLVSTNRLM